MFTRLRCPYVRRLLPLPPVPYPLTCRSFFTSQRPSLAAQSPPTAMFHPTVAEAALSDEPIISIHRSGQLVEQGTHSQLLTRNGLYNQLARQAAQSLHSPPEPAGAQKLLWLDLEMTGLDESIHRILEVAVVITDITLRPHARYQAVVQQPPDALTHMNDYVRQMHTKTGLLDRLAAGKPEQTVEAELCSLIDSTFGAPGGRGVKVLLAGNTVHMDRRFIRRYWPEVEKRLHYRIVDVSSFKEVTAPHNSHGPQHSMTVGH